MDSQADPSKLPGAGQVFVLIVGIDSYIRAAEYPTLDGCVNDANAFRDFLLDTRESCGLEVPAGNIKFLTDEDATRSAIISTFQSHFINNPQIPDNGNTTMIFFFAGHGDRVAAPSNLKSSSDGMVETICPHDEGTLDAAGQYVHGIPDYVLGWLLHELAATKGKNITVIFDSCHSGGMGRKVGRARAPRKRKVPLRPIPLELDDYLWKHKTGAAPSYSLWTPTTTSHVLLAACNEEETAREVEYADGTTRGRFSDSLIKCLRRVPLEDITYAELLTRLPSWSGQTPHCGGVDRDQLLFRKNYPATGARALTLKPHTVADPQKPNILQSFLVDIGSIEGVVPATEFAVRAADNTFVCTLVAHSVEVHQTVLVAANERSVTIPDGARVVVADWKNDPMVLHVYVVPGFPHPDALFPTAEITRQPKGRKFVRAAAANNADIVLRAEGGDIVIEHRTSAFTETGRETRVPRSRLGSIAHLPKVLDGIAHFNYFLERHHGSAPLEGVALEMYRLAGEWPGYKPDTTIGNMVKLDEARFTLESGAKYGFIFRNNTADDLFPYLFYFDPEDYTITPWYVPENPTARAPLHSRGGTVTKGMGGERALQFSLPENTTSSSGFLKLFVSTDHLNLGWIKQQTSPLDPTFEGTGRLTVEPFVGIAKWDALLVLLTMTADD
ncbi:caspase domain-containing protein [Mycena rebaudengoi]|nr:caspase domain-containing protein [Mycena rebaudengoi]